MIVDSVRGHQPQRDRDRETPEFGAKVVTAYLMGMAEVKGAIKTLL
ncbi:MAG: hypothetical protein IPL39_14690 [Opitutaceae bacterium]|nr:hypothetical protein [Opitutaceae bacterium]